MNVKIKVNPLWLKRELKETLLEYFVILCSFVILFNIVYSQDNSVYSQGTLLSSGIMSYLSFEHYGVYIPSTSDYFKIITLPLFMIAGIILFVKSLELLIFIVIIIISKTFQLLTFLLKKIIV
ncbi:TPA: hypothetical protein QCY08_002415 [Bacillus paranthracis]|nr:hypothetical protein [Bacillus paranthracis]